MGLLTLMALSPNRPIAVNEHANQIVPSMLMLFDGLNRAYTSEYMNPFFYFVLLVKKDKISYEFII